ncbi:hypothetical protein BH23GEM6_BH23GEM6_23580 [soil metagenome]
MGISKTLMKTAGVAAATKATRSFAKAQSKNLSAAADWATDRVRPRRKKTLFGLTAAKGLGAAAVALPIGLWLGRRARNGRLDDQRPEMNR